LKHNLTEVIHAVDDLALFGVKGTPVHTMNAASEAARIFDRLAARIDGDLAAGADGTPN